MTSLRTALVGLTGAALLVTPAGAAALAPPASAPTTTTAATTQSMTPAQVPVAARYNTWIRYLRFDHTRPWSSRVTIRGQVAARVNGERGALRGRLVRLYRQLDGRSTWVHLDTRLTSRTSRPKFRFEVRAKANADYRVIYRGNDKYQPSRKITHVSVHRIFNARLRDGSGRFHGRVQPDYRNKVIRLEKRSCAGCGWHKARSRDTGDRGFWRFRVRAPRSGRWWWRVSVPGSTAYIRSISPVFTTELR